MFENLLKHVAELPEDKLALVHLEDITICAAWLDSFHDQPEVVEPYAVIRQKLDLWVNTCTPQNEETEGCRQQPLLRVLLDELVQGGISKMRREDLDMLYFSWGLMNRASHNETFQRTISLMEPHIQNINTQREALPISPGIEGLGKRITVITPQDLREAASRDVKIFAGLDTPIRGPVLVVSGDAKLLGDVPDGHALAVEEGSCTVQGQISGKLAATRTCEIYGNIGGVVVSRRGNIRCRALLPQSIAVAKEGSVQAISAEMTKMTFGCTLVQIRNSSIGSNLLGRCIEVREDIVAGCIQVSEQATCRRFQNDGDKKLSIVLRRGLSPQDYGEVLLIESLRLLTTAIKLRQKYANFVEILGMSEREADDYAGSVLVFLLGDDSSAANVTHLQAHRRRLAYLDRLAAAAKNLSGFIEERLASPQDSNGAEERSVIPTFGVVVQVK